MCLRYVSFDGQSRQIHPAGTTVEDDAVGGGDDLGGDGKRRVGIGVKLDVPIPILGRGGFQEKRPQAAAVGYRRVEQPAAIRDAPLCEQTADDAGRRQRLLDFAIRPVHAGHVAIAAVAGGQNHATGQRRFERRQHVVTVEPDGAVLRRYGQRARLGVNPFATAAARGDEEKNEQKNDSFDSN